MGEQQPFINADGFVSKVKELLENVIEASGVITNYALELDLLTQIISKDIISSTDSMQEACDKLNSVDVSKLHLLGRKSLEPYIIKTLGLSKSASVSLVAVLKVLATIPYNPECSTTTLIEGRGDTEKLGHSSSSFNASTVDRVLSKGYSKIETHDSEHEEKLKDITLSNLEDLIRGATCKTSEEDIKTYAKFFHETMVINSGMTTYICQVLSVLVFLTDTGEEHFYLRSDGTDYPIHGKHSRYYRVAKFRIVFEHPNVSVKLNKDIKDFSELIKVIDAVYPAFWLDMVRVGSIQILNRWKSEKSFTVRALKEAPIDTVAGQPDNFSSNDNTRLPYLVATMQPTIRAYIGMLPKSSTISDFEGMSSSAKLFMTFLVNFIYTHDPSQLVHLADTYKEVLYITQDKIAEYSKKHMLANPLAQNTRERYASGLEFSFGYYIKELHFLETGIATAGALMYNLQNQDVFSMDFPNTTHVKNIYEGYDTVKKVILTRAFSEKDPTHIYKLKASIEKYGLLEFPIEYLDYFKMPYLRELFKYKSHLIMLSINTMIKLRKKINPKFNLSRRYLSKKRVRKKRMRRIY